MQDYATQTNDALGPRKTELQAHATFMTVNKPSKPWRPQDIGIHPITNDSAQMEPKELVGKWVEAFNRSDIVSLVSLYEENAVNHQVRECSIRGRSAICEMYKKTFAMKKTDCILENIFQDGEWVILEWSDLQGLRGCDFFQVKNGKIAFQTGY